MKKILVIGCPGSGKSTFARFLSHKTDLPLYYLDRIWHLPDQTNVTIEEFEKQLKEIMSREQWIIDGNYLRTLEMRLVQCDTVFFLDFPLEVCLSGVESRIGKEREDMPWVETEFDSEFKQFILYFPQNKLPKIYALLEKYRENREIVIFKTRSELENFTI
jgi:adenylate kinase family enzyme